MESKYLFCLNLKPSFDFINDYGKVTYKTIITGGKGPQVEYMFESQTFNHFYVVSSFCFINNIYH